MCILAGRPSLERLRHQCPSSRRNREPTQCQTNYPCTSARDAENRQKGPGLILAVVGFHHHSTLCFTVTVYENKGGEVNHAED